jgi:hypothetical protein
MREIIPFRDDTAKEHGFDAELKSAAFSVREPGHRLDQGGPAQKSLCYWKRFSERFVSTYWVEESSLECRRRVKLELTLGL